MYLLTTYHSTLDQSPAMPRPFYNCSFQRLLPSPRRSLQGSRLLFHNDIQVIYFLLAAVAFVTDYLLGPLIIIIEIIIMFIIIIISRVAVFIGLIISRNISIKLKNSLSIAPISSTVSYTLHFILHFALIMKTLFLRLRL